MNPPQIVRRNPAVALGFVTWMFAAAVASADLISIPTGNVTASSEIPPNFNRQDDFIVDGSGLVDGQHIPAVEPNMWLSTGTAFGGDDLDPSVIFDLGAVYTINSFHVWNYNESPPDLTARGVNAVTVEYGATAALGSVVPGVTNFVKADGLPTYAGEAFEDFPPFSARFIKFDIDSNHGGDNNFYGLSEVQFDGVLGGLGLSSATFSTTGSQGDPVGTLSTPAGDAGDTFTYALVAGDGDDDNDKFQIGGDELQLGAHDFSTAANGEVFLVRVRSTGAPSGAMVDAEFVLIISAPDLTAPEILTLVPANGSADASAGGNLVVIFDEPVVVGTGDITIKNLSDGTQVQIPVGDPQVTVDVNGVLTINPIDDLLLDKNYAVRISDTAVDDLSGNSFAGIGDDTTWSFTVPPAAPFGLVGYWPFDADADPQPDLSGFGNDAAVFPGASWVDDAERGGVMEFDGNDSYLEAADSPSLSLTGDFTIAAWINPTDYTGFRGVVGKSAGPAGNLPASYDLYLVANDGRARLYTGSPDGFGQVTATTVPALGEWHHLAVTRVGDEVTFYYDGQLDGQGTTPQPLLDSDATLRIGNRTDLVTDFLGRMDDVAIINGGLAADQITSIMNGDFSEVGGGGGAPFAITAVSYDPAGPSVSITFNSRPGIAYALDFATTLDAEGQPGGWQELDDGVESEGSSTTTVDSSPAAALETVFYRIRLPE